MSSTTETNPSRPEAKPDAGKLDTGKAAPSSGSAYSGHAETRTWPPARVEPAETPGLTGLLTLAVGVVAIAGLYLGRDVLVPIALAVLLSFLLAPLANLLRRLYLGRVGSVMLSVLLAMGIGVALFGLIGTQLAELAQQAPQYQSTVEKKIGTVRQFTTQHIDDVLRQLNPRARTDSGAGGSAVSPNAVTPDLHQDAAGSPTTAQTLGTEAHPMPVEVHQPSPSPMDVAIRIVSQIVGPFGTGAIVLIFSIFVLLQREDLRDRMIRLVGSGDLHRTTVVMNDAAQRLSRYFVTQLGINVGFGIVIGGGLFAIGVPSPLLWAVLGALLRFVPYVGVPLSAVLPIALAAAVEPGWSMMLWTIALYVVVEVTLGQLVEPMLYGHSTGLSPFAVVVAATFWTWLWGPIGLILSTPLTLCLVVLGRHVDRLEFLDVLLGDRPALTPIESFYQRMLSGDADEAAVQAELLLRDRSLSSYYDEVALPGLRLAANDALRGVLTERQLERVRGAFANLVHDLDGHEDADPAAAARQIGSAEPIDPGTVTRAERSLVRNAAPERQAPEYADLPAAWAGRDPVLCVGGRGPLDEGVASMLSQLLRKHRIGARIAGFEAVSREGIRSLDLDGVALVCVSYLDPGGTTSALRFLVRRLRQRLPGIPVVVGLWGNETDGLAPPSNPNAEATFPGADHVARSLHDVIELALDYAHGERSLQPSQTLGGAAIRTQPIAAAGADLPVAGHSAPAR